MPEHQTHEVGLVIETKMVSGYGNQNKWKPGTCMRGMFAPVIAKADKR